jgi:two-component system, chemotaxis family, response regulator Rcp1
MNKEPHILLVEDSEDDIVILKDMLSKHDLISNLAIVRDGDEAISYVFKTAGYADETTPDLILLDLNLPKRNGMEVLKTIRSSKNYSHIPVVVLSTSSCPSDVKQSYQESANCFITKPADVDSLFNMIELIKSFWLKTVQLPQHYV